MTGLYKAIIDLIEDAEMEGLPPVYTAVPQVENRQYPYMVVSNLTSSVYNTQTSQGKKMIIDIHIWDIHPSTKKIEDALYALWDILAGAQPDGFDTLVFENEKIIQDPNGNFHGIITFSTYIRRNIMLNT